MAPGMNILLAALDSDYAARKGAVKTEETPRFELSRVIPFAFLHLGCLLALFSGVSWFAVGLAAALYWVRMFAVTGFYLRYFSHRTLRTSRLMQFVFAVIGLTCVQRGPLWWASHHRKHHQYSDQPQDLHSPIQRGFWWAHIGWMTSSDNLQTDYSRVKDLARFPELVFLNRFDWLVPLLFALSIVGLGEWLRHVAPGLQTSGLQLLAWGFFISTVVLFHGTCAINSLSHQFGFRRYETGDTSRNNFWLALLTMGEGWHNNHHWYMNSTRQGFYWWEVDVTYYILKGMATLGLISHLNPVPEDVLLPVVTEQAAA